MVVENRFAMLYEQIIRLKKCMEAHRLIVQCASIHFLKLVLMISFFRSITLNLHDLNYWHNIVQMIIYNWTTRRRDIMSRQFDEYMEDKFEYQGEWVPLFELFYRKVGLVISEKPCNMGLSAFSCQGTDSPKRSKRKTNIFMHGGYLDTTFR